MTFSADRATGAFFFVFGILLYFIVIPEQTDSGGDSWVLPDTIPNAMAMVMAIGGALLTVKPTDQPGQNPADVMYAAIYLGLLALGLYAMAHFGFSYTAPFIALLIMFLIGERRPLWLGIGVIGMPVTIWVLVVYLLERSLP